MKFAIASLLASLVPALSLTAEEDASLTVVSDCATPEDAQVPDSTGSGESNSDSPADGADDEPTDPL